MKHLIFLLLSACCSLSALAARQTVSIDENGDIQPAAAREAIAQASSAAVKVDFALAKAEILTNIQETAIETLAEANDILTTRTDFALVQLTASGVKDALSATNTASEGKISIVDNVQIDRTTDPANVLVTLTWQYVTGSFSSPRIVASAELSTNAWETVEMTEPVQIEWGTNSAFRATATLPKTTYGSQAFFKILATPDAPVDDGQVFDIFSDGTDYWLDLVPSRRYRIRIVSGRITTVNLVE